MGAVAEQFGIPVTKVSDHLNNNKLVAIKREGKRLIPQALVRDHSHPSKFVAAVITVLADGGYTDEEILVFLFAEDDTLPGRPVDHLHGHGAREVIRRAQARAL